MKKIIITSLGYEGEVILIYDTESQLQHLDFSAAVVTVAQIEYFKKHVPSQYEGLEALRVAYRSNTAVFTEVKHTITFEMFYDKYKLKRNPGRAKTAWKNLSEAEKIRAYSGIDVYHRDLAANPWKTKAHPHTYLVTKKWNDEY